MYLKLYHVICNLPFSIVYTDIFLDIGFVYDVSFIPEI